MARSAARDPEFTLTAGTYYVVARLGGHELRDRLTVRAGQRTSRVLVLGAGKVRLATRLTGAQAPLADHVTYRIERLDGGKEIQHTARPDAELDLPAGRYRFESRVAPTGLVQVREIDVKAGTALQLTFDHPVGFARLRLVEPGGGQAVGEPFWEVRDKAGRPIWAGQAVEPRVPLAPGSYRAVAEHRDRRFERAFDITAGDQRQVDVRAE